MKLMKGAAILGAAALISKLIGAIYRIPYQNITGDVGLYVYNQVYPVYTILLSLATFGFPLAISKTVSEKLVVGDRAGAKRVFYLSALVLFITGFLLFLVLFFAAPSIALLMANDPNLTMPIRSISFALLLVPVMAAMRGYFQGHQNMIPTAVSQVAEQFVRVITILALAYWFMANGYSVYHAGSGAVFGAVTGAIASLLVLLYFWARMSKQDRYVRDALASDALAPEPAKEIISNLLKLAIPMAAGTLVLPLMQMVDTFTVKNMLDIVGETNTAFLTGVLGRGQPLVQFAAFVAAPLSLALLPAISEAKARQQQQTIHRFTDLSMRLTLLIALPAAIGLIVIAEPLNIFVYKDNVGSMTIAVLALTTIFSTMGVTTSGILQGIGKVNRPARNLLIGVLFKVIFNILLIPFMGITGAALASVLAYFIATTLNILAVSKYTGTALRARDYILKPLLAVGVMALVAEIVKVTSIEMLTPWIGQERILNGIVVFLAIGVAVIVYGVMLLITGAVRTSDLEAIPRTQKFVRLLKRLKLLRY